MKKCILAAGLALTTAICSAQVTFTDVLDVSRAASSAVHSSTYVPGADKFLVGHVATIEVFNGTTGNFESNLDITGITPSGTLGFFAITATEDGHVYAYEDGGKDIWRWSTVAGTAEKVYDTAAFARVGYTGTIGTDITVAFTGAASDGAVEFFTDSFPFASGSFTFDESAAIQGKSSLAINEDGTVAFTVGDTGGVPIEKWVKTDGTWSAEPLWSILLNTTGGGGPMAYDSVNDILFVLLAPGSTNTLYALDGATGEVIGTDTVTSALSSTTGYAGGYAMSIPASGTVALVGRGAPSTNAVMYKWAYVVDTSDVDDWSLYKE